MAKLTITEAIKRSPIGKSQFYSKYLDGGVITVSVDENNKKYIDSSELLRVFGGIGGEQPPEVLKTSDPNDTGKKTDEQSSIIKLLKEQLADQKVEAEKREQFYQSQIITLTNRLEAPKPPVKRQSRISKWWFGLDKE